MVTKENINRNLGNVIDICNLISGVTVYPDDCFIDTNIAHIELFYGDINKYTNERFDRETLNKIIEFTCKLASILADLTKQSDGISPEPIYDIELSLNWSGDKIFPTILITFPINDILEVANILSLVKNGLMNGK